MKSQTAGTWIVIVANCVLAILGILQAVDWVHLVGGQSAGLIAAVLAFVNVLAHYYTGPDVKFPTST